MEKRETAHLNFGTCAMNISKSIVYLFIAEQMPFTYFNWLRLMRSELNIQWKRLHSVNCEHRVDAAIALNVTQSCVVSMCYFGFCFLSIYNAASAMNCILFINPPQSSVDTVTVPLWSRSCWAVALLELWVFASNGCVVWMFLCFLWWCHLSMSFAVIWRIWKRTRIALCSSHRTLETRLVAYKRRCESVWHCLAQCKLK